MTCGEGGGVSVTSFGGSEGEGTYQWGVSSLPNFLSIELVLLSFHLIHLSSFLLTIFFSLILLPRSHTLPYK